MNGTIITLLVTAAPCCIGFAAFGWWALRQASAERERARMSHLAGIDAHKLAESYHQSGKTLMKQALESYEEGQEFWATATHTLLDAKRREKRVEDMVESLKQRGLNVDWKEVA